MSLSIFFISTKIKCEITFTVLEKTPEIDLYL